MEPGHGKKANWLFGRFERGGVQTDSRAGHFSLRFLYSHLVRTFIAIARKEIIPSRRSVRNGNFVIGIAISPCFGRWNTDLGK